MKHLGFHSNMTPRLISNTLLLLPMKFALAFAFRQTNMFS